MRGYSCRPIFFQSTGLEKCTAWVRFMMPFIMVSHFRSSASSIGLWTNPVLVRLSRCCGAPTEGLSVCASGGGGAWQCCECAVARRGRRFAPSVRDGQGALAQGARRRSAGGGPLRACCQEGRALDAPPPWWPRQQHQALDPQRRKHLSDDPTPMRAHAMVISRLVPAGPHATAALQQRQLGFEWRRVRCTTFRT